MVALVEADYLIYCGVKETTGSNIYRIPQMADLVEVGHSATGVGHCDPGVGHSETEETSKDTSKETQRVVVVGLEKIGITDKDAKKLISRYGIDTITETQEALQEARETGFKAGNPAGVLVWALEHGGPKGVKKIVKSEKAVPSYSGEGFEDFWDA